MKTLAVVCCGGVVVALTIAVLAALTPLTTGQAAGWAFLGFLVLFLVALVVAVFEG